VLREIVFLTFPIIISIVNMCMYVGFMLNSIVNVDSYSNNNYGDIVEG